MKKCSEYLVCFSFLLISVLQSEWRWKMSLLIRGSEVLWMYKLRFVWAWTCPFVGPAGNWVGHLIGRKICGSVHTCSEFPHRAGMLGGQLGREAWAGRHLSSSQYGGCSPYTSHFINTQAARTLSCRQNVLHAGSRSCFSFRPCCAAVNFTSRDKPQSGIMWQNLL